MPTDPKKLAAAYETLKKIRASKTVALKAISRMKTEIVGFTGKPEPFKLRYYQVQGAFHLMTMKRMILGDGTGLGKCVTEDTLLITDHGAIPIWELAPDAELTPGAFYEPRQAVHVWTGAEMAPVKQFYWNGSGPTKRVTTRNGFQVEGSLVHPVLVRTPDEETFRQLPSVEVGDYLCIDRSPAPFPVEEPSLSAPSVASNAKAFDYPPALTPSLARLLGYVVAEAWTNGKYVTTITQHVEVNPEVHADIRNLLLEVFGWEGGQGNAEKDVCISIGIRKYLEACGVAYTTARFKEVPWSILRGSKASVREFLRGIFEGEASVAEGGVEFSSSSEKLIRTLQVLLLRFGVVSTLSPKMVRGYDHTYWRLTFFGESARIFSQDIGFVSTRKVEALKAGLSETLNPNKDLVPYMGEVVADLKEALLEATSKTGHNSNRKGSGLKQFGESFQSTLKHIIHGKRNPTYQWLRQFLEISAAQGLTEHPAFKDIVGVVRTHFFYDPIVRIEDGYAALMDIEVDHPKHCFSGNGVVNHNTIEAVAALAYLWEKEPKNKVIVVAPKSAIRQWASEVKRFTNGVQTILATGTVEERKAAYHAFQLASTAPDAPKVILILNYAILLRDWNLEGWRPTLPNGRADPKKPVVPGVLDKMTQAIGEDLIVVFDEATAFKNMRTKTWEVARFLSDRAGRVYGLTATLLKNNLMEGYCIYKAIKPELFGTKQKFYDQFCFIELRQVARARIPIILGYKNLDQFRAIIDPYFLGRPRHAVSDELPTLTTREIAFELNRAENTKYQEALDGLLELGDGTVKEFEEQKALVSLIYCQQVVNSLSLLRFKEGDEVLDFSPIEENDSHKIGSLSGKEQALVDLLTDELDSEKVIVYTRFASLVPRLQEILKNAGIKATRITGKESDKARQKNQAAFQDLESDTKVIFVTAAGTEAINLQAAGAMIFYDAPWSWGDYVQALGRMIRIGSPHPAVVAYHLIAERPGTEKNTIDHHVLKMLRKKKGLIDKVLGESALGALKFEKGEKGGVLDLLRAMRAKKAE